MKKGFTLAELLGVIVVIGLLLLLLIPLIINGVKNKEEEVGYVQEEIIYDAVSEYLDGDKGSFPGNPGDVYCVSIDELIQAGKLVDPVKKIVEEGNYDADTTIEVVIGQDGTRTYTMKDSKSCVARSNQNILIIVSPNNNTWSKSKTATIIYPSDTDFNNENYEKQYRVDNGNWIVTPSNASQEFSGAVEKHNIEARVIDKTSGKTIISKKGTVEKIDNGKPRLVNITRGNWNDNLEEQVNITLTDALSGVSAYCITTSSAKPSSNDSCFKKYKLPSYGGTGTVTKYLKQGTYYLHVKDKVGNILYADDASNGGKAIFKVEDKTPPTCTIISSGTKGTNNWYIGDVTVKSTNRDEGSGIKQYYLGTSSTVTYNNLCGTTPGRVLSKECSLTHKTDTKGTSYYGYVMDRAGNTGKCVIASAVKRDTVKPSVSASAKFTSSNNFSISLSDSTSGLVGYAITQSTSTPTSWTSISGSSYNNKNITKEEGHYYVHVKDAAGHVSRTSSSYEVYYDCWDEREDSWIEDGCTVKCGGGTNNLRDPKTKTICKVETCNTQSCIPLNSCKIRGDVLKNNVYPWDCHSNNKHGKHSSGYTHYCSDSKGNLLDKDDDSSVVKFRWVCPISPYGPSDGWTVLKGY